MADKQRPYDPRRGWLWGIAAAALVSAAFGIMAAIEAGLDSDRSRLQGLGALGSFPLAAGLIMLMRSSRVRAWPSVLGTVASAEVVIDPHIGEDGTYVPRVRYDYEAGGARLAGRRVSLNKLRFTGAKDAQYVVSLCQPGSKVMVFYDPETPSESILFPPELLLERCLILVGLGLLVPAAAVMAYLGAG